MLSGFGIAVGVTLPMIFKGSGVFGDAPGPFSPAGSVILLGVGIILVGVFLSLLAGFGRDRLRHKSDGIERASAGFLPGLLMAVAAGILSAGLALGFVYAQDPIVAAVTVRGERRWRPTWPFGPSDW